MKKQIDIIGVASIKNDKMTKFMQHADLFQSYKVLAELIEVHYTLTYEGEDESLDKLRSHFNTGLGFAQIEFEKDLIYCHIQYVQQGDIKIENKSVVPFVTPDVSVTSDGTTFGLVIDQIKHFCPGIKIEEGEIRKIKSLSWPQQEKT